MNRQNKYKGYLNLYAVAIAFVLTFNCFTYNVQPVVANTIPNGNQTITVSRDNSTITISISNRSDSNSEKSIVDPETLINSVTTAGGIATVFVGVITYRQSQIIKRKDITKDIIIPLIQQYESQELKKAKDILKGCQIIGESMDNERFYDKNNLESILRNTDEKPTPMLTKTEKEIRDSFDAFLQFLMKVDYMVSVGVLNKDEISYFKYFIDQVANDINVINYRNMKGFTLQKAR